MQTLDYYTTPTGETVIFQGEPFISAGEAWIRIRHITIEGKRITFLRSGDTYPLADMTGPITIKYEMACYPR